MVGVLSRLCPHRLRSKLGSWQTVSLFHAIIPRSPTLSLRAVVAGLLHVPRDSVRLLPAVPAVGDHAHNGIVSRQVYALAPGGSDDGVPYVLDLRRLLLPIYLASAPGGRLRIDSLWARLRPRCPAGFFMRVHGGFALGDEANRYRAVFPGQVIVVEFLPSRPRNPAFDEDADAASDEDSDRHEPDEPRDEAGERTSLSGSSSALRTDAGTGGTRAGFLQGTTHAVCGLVLWGNGLGITAVDAGCRNLTSARPHQCCPIHVSRAGGPSALAHVVGWVLVSFVGLVLRCAVTTCALRPGSLALPSAGLPFAFCCCCLLRHMGSWECSSLTCRQARVYPDLLFPHPPCLVCPERALSYRRTAVHQLRHAVPFPPRAGRLPSLLCFPLLTDEVAGTDALVTLLEQSRHKYGDGTFFEARALLETLVEHFQGEAPSAALPPPVPFQLSLAMLLDSVHVSPGHATCAGTVPWHDLSHRPTYAVSVQSFPQVSYLSPSTSRSAFSNGLRRGLLVCSPPTLLSFASHLMVPFLRPLDQQAGAWFCQS